MLVKTVITSVTETFHAAMPAKLEVRPSMVSEWGNFADSKMQNLREDVAANRSATIAYDAEVDRIKQAEMDAAVANAAA